MYVVIVLIFEVWLALVTSASSLPPTSSTTDVNSAYTTSQSTPTITYITGSGSSYSTTPSSTAEITTSDISTIGGTTESVTTPENTSPEDMEKLSGSGSKDISDTTSNTDNVTVLVGDEAVLQEECTTIDCKEDVIQKAFHSYIDYAFQWESEAGYKEVVSDIECARSCSRLKECAGFHFQLKKCALIMNSIPK